MVHLAASIFCLLMARLYLGQGAKVELLEGQTVQGIDDESLMKSVPQAVKETINSIPQKEYKEGEYVSRTKWQPIPIKVMIKYSPRFSQFCYKCPHSSKPGTEEKHSKTEHTSAEPSTIAWQDLRRKATHMMNILEKRYKGEDISEYVTKSVHSLLKFVHPLPKDVLPSYIELRFNHVMLIAFVIPPESGQEQG